MKGRDPAVLFYTSDFLTATFTWSNEHVGMYIKLLCLQHQQNRLSEDDMMNICGTYVERIFSKFKKDEDGYYNQRMDDEKKRRKKYSESRRDNRKGGSNISKSYDEHMETVTETVTKTKNDNKPTLDEFLSYAISNKPTVDKSAVELKYKSWSEAGWKDGNDKPIKNWKSKLLNTLPYIKDRPEKIEKNLYPGYKESSFD